MVGHDDRINPKLRRYFCVFGIQDAFQNHLAAPFFHQGLNLLPIERLVKLLGGPGAERGGVGDAADMSHDIAKAAALGAEHLKAPAPFSGQIGYGLGGEFRWGR